MPTLENKMIHKLLKHLDTDLKVLEVGCGYGQKIEFLKSIGFNNIVGVEKNIELVNRAKSDGHVVYTIEEFEDKFEKGSFDLLFLSHIVEHFQYSDLKQFLEGYFVFLKDGGHLIVATPVMNPNFYDDFDHVKPYTHLGFLSVFGERSSQVQFYSRIQLKLLDLYYVRTSFQLKHYRALALRTGFYRIPRICNQLLHLIYRLSFRLIGRPLSWVGLFSKTTHETE